MVFRHTCCGYAVRLRFSLKLAGDLLAVVSRIENLRRKIVTSKKEVCDLDTFTRFIFTILDIW